MVRGQLYEEVIESHLCKPPGGFLLLPKGDLQWDGIHNIIQLRRKLETATFQEAHLADA
jgi:hypothetical protein